MTKLPTVQTSFVGRQLELKEITRLVKAAHGPNHERLVALKNKYDPNNLFRLNQNIRPNN